MIIRKMIIFFATFIAHLYAGATTLDIKPIDQRTHEIDLTIPVAAGDALYSQSLDIRFDNPSIDLFSISIETPSIRTFDEKTKTQKTIFDKPVHIILRAESPDTATLTSATLTLSYQLASHKEPIHEKIALAKNHIDTTMTLPQGTPEQNTTPRLLSWATRLTDSITNNNSLAMRLLLVFLLGILMSLTPCIYPMIPVTAGILQSQTTKSLWISFSLSLSYTLGIATTFATLGLLAAFAGQAMGNILYKPTFIIPLVILLFYMALVMVGAVNLYTPQFLRARDHKVTGGSFISAFIFGAASGIIASPCLSPGLVCLLCLVTTLGSKIIGFLLLFSFGVGLSVPLLIIGTFSSSLALLPRAGIWMEEVKKIFGFFMMGMCLYFLDPILPPFAKWILLPLLLSTIGIYYILISNRYHTCKARIATIFFGLLLLASSGYILIQKYLMKEEVDPLRHFWKTDYNAALDEAKRAQKLVFVDIGAPSCSICKAIEKKIFAQKAVQKALQEVSIPVKIDGSATDNQALMTQFHIIGFPTILLVDPNTERVRTQWGPELYNATPEDFITQLQQ